MQIGMIGLGRMGAQMTRRLIQGGHQVSAYDRESSAVSEAAAAGAACADSLEPLVAQMRPPRVVWMMLPAGEAVDSTIDQLKRLLASGDVIVDGGNSNYRDSMRRAEAVRGHGLQYVDVGTSGGIWGMKEGFCLMAGGDAAVIDRLTPLLDALAPAPGRGWAHVGKCGAGHFAKMVHNGIEYGLMQSYAEGFAFLDGKKEFGFDLPQMAELWRHGSVIRSWLLDLAAEALRENPTLGGVAARVADSGEGRWFVSEAVAADTPCPVITLSLLERIRSRATESFANKMLAVLRNKFGGHEVQRS